MQGPCPQCSKARLSRWEETQVHLGPPFSCTTSTSRLGSIPFCFVCVCIFLFFLLVIKTMTSLVGPRKKWGCNFSNVQKLNQGLLFSQVLQCLHLRHCGYESARLNCTQCAVPGFYTRSLFRSWEGVLEALYPSMKGRVMMVRSRWELVNHFKKLSVCLGASPAQTHFKITLETYDPCIIIAVLCLWVLWVEIGFFQKSFQNSNFFWLMNKYQTSVVQLPRVDWLWGMEYFVWTNGSRQNTHTNIIGIWCPR